MKIIIGNQTYESKSWDQPILASKKVKNKIAFLYRVYKEKQVLNILSKALLSAWPDFSAV